MTRSPDNDYVGHYQATIAPQTYQIRKIAYLKGKIFAQQSQPSMEVLDAESRAYLPNFILSLTRGCKPSEIIGKQTVFAIKEEITTENQDSDRHPPLKSHNPRLTVELVTSKLGDLFLGLPQLGARLLFLQICVHSDLNKNSSGNKARFNGSQVISDNFVRVN